MSDQDYSRVLDWNAALELAGGNAQLAQDLLQMLIEEAPRLLERLEHGLNGGDPQALWDDAHKLHGSTAYCGVPALREASAGLESAIKQDDLPGVRTRVAEVRQALDALIAAAERSPGP